MIRERTSVRSSSLLRWLPGRGTRAARGDAHYGVVSVESVLYTAPMVRSASESVDAADPVFLLNTDMWDM